MVKSMNRRATLLADAKKEWRAEEPFRLLVEWTKIASAKELGELAGDDVGTTAAGRLLCRILFRLTGGDARTVDPAFVS